MRGLRGMAAPFMVCVASAVFLGVAVIAGQSTEDRELENVAAFSRLFGVVRYFYPSDAAASLDWDRFAVYGVSRVRGARSTEVLKATLQELFSPLGPFLEIGTRPKSSTARFDAGGTVAWQYLGVPFAWPTPRGAFTMKRGHRPYIRGAAIVKQTISAEALRRKRIRLTGQVRALAADSSGVAVLTLTVNRGPAGVGFSDIMRDRPIRNDHLRDYAIEGVVDADAIDVTVGLLASGAITADFGDIRLDVREPQGDQWSPVALPDAGFDAPPSASPWLPSGFKAFRVERVANEALQQRHFLRITPLPESADEKLFDEPSPIVGGRTDVSLGAGISARIPLVLTESDAVASLSQDSVGALRTSLAALPASQDSANRDERLADVVVAWNVLRHFYPYSAEVEVDWDRRLKHHLQSAYNAANRDEQADALRALLVDARDGHARVLDAASETFICPICPARRKDRAFLPFQIGMVEGQFAVTASDDARAVPPGAIVSAMDGVPIARRFQRTLAFVSGSQQWRTVRAMQEILTCDAGSLVNVRLDLPDQTARVAPLRCDRAEPPPETRPEKITEIEPGVWYVDATRAANADLSPKIATIARAKAVVFDVRGYPTGIGTDIVRHLIDSEQTAPWLYAAKIAAPFGQFSGWSTVPFGLSPAIPRFSGRMFFLTDSRAISAGEVLIGYVSDLKLGTVIGSATAGTNGNVVDFALPGAFTVTFTGMRATRHDGRTAYHAVGIPPDIAAAPTLEALRHGRDTVLERALNAIRQPQ